MSSTPVLYENFPKELRESNLWNVYKLEPREDGKMNKLPFDPKTNKRANDPGLGVGLEEVKHALNNGGGYSGPGHYVVPPFVVIDIDNCVDPKSGDVAKYAQDIVLECNSYTEASISGTGLHIWIRGIKPGDRCRKGIEMYGSKRFMCMTGFHVAGTPQEIREVDITPIYEKMLRGDFVEAQAITTPTTSASSNSKGTVRLILKGTCITTKEQIFMKGEIIQEKNPFIIQDEHGNRVEVDDSQSEADLSLATALAFKYEGNLEAIECDFRESSLYRPKWDRQDYRDSTLKRAITTFKSRLNKSAASQMTEEDTKDQFSVYDEDVTPTADFALPSFPRIPGSIGDLADAMSPDIPYLFKVACGICHMGLIRSGLDCLRDEPHRQPRSYIVLVSEPNQGKTAAMSEVGRVFKSIGGHYSVITSIDSAPALCDEFYRVNQAQLMRSVADANAPNMAKLLANSDEAKNIFEKGRSSPNSRNSLLIDLLELFETNNSQNNARGSKIKVRLDNAHLCLLGGATPSSYGSMWQGTGANLDGLQSRISPIGYNGAKVPAFQRPADLEKLTAVTQRLVDQANAPAESFTISDGAKQLFSDWWSSKDQTNPSEVRIEGIVKRLLIVLCRSNDVNEVDVDLMRVGIEYGEYIIACRDKFNPLDSVSWTQYFENVIIACHEKHGDMTGRQCRQRVQPYRKPGGVGVFNNAHLNLVRGGMLISIGNNRSGKAIYRLEK